MKIGLDMMGGDFAPAEAAKGIALYLLDAPEAVQVVAIGDEAACTPLLTTAPAGRVTVIDAPERIEMHDHPVKALKEKQQSSIAVGFRLLKEGKIDAFISAGNTGAMLVGAQFSIKPIPGITRPTIAAVFPRTNGEYGVLCDVGLNADCKPENYVQFAQLGSLYAEHILGFENPKVGLINIGEEEGKGNLAAQEAYQALKTAPRIHFTGNIEGRDVFSSKADVMVCDGFTGNIILKLGESLYDIAHSRGIKDDFFEHCNFEWHGGTPILGVSKPVIIGHGISHETAFKNMLRVAQKMIASDLMGKMKDAFGEQP
jgi:phosphate acyltransferase